MENVIHRLTLDLTRPGNGACLTVQRGDTARTLVVSLAQNGRPYRISDGVTAVFYARKSDGVPLFNSCIIDQNTVRYDFTGQTTNVEGAVECEIKLYGPDMELLTSAPFELMVEDTVHQEGDIPDSSPEYTALTELVSRGTELIGNLEGLSEELLPIRDEVKRNARDAEEAALAARDYANNAQLARDDILRLADRAEDAARRAEEAADRAGAAMDGCASEDYVNDAVAELWAEIRYVPIAISNFRHNAGTVELGTVLDFVELSWNLNKDPALQKLDNAMLLSVARSVEQPGPFAKTTSFTLTVTDEREAQDTASTTVYFYPGVYYGAMAVDAQLDSAAILALKRTLRGDRKITFTAECGGLRPVFACPSRYGTPKFVIGGFEYDWNHAATIAFTNDSGHTESYDVWMHGQDVAGSITVTVS